jgi:tol-pal system protein YbgF
MPISFSKYRVGLWPVVFLPALLFGCVTGQEEIKYLNDQVVVLNTQLKSLQERHADVVADLDKIREEIKDLSGKQQDNRQLMKRAIEKDIPAGSSSKAISPDLTRRIAKLEADVRQLNEYLGFESSRAEEASSQPQVTSEQQLYDLTYANYKDEKYIQAIAGFKNFLTKYPRSDLADNAQFWIGECHMALEQYEQAILAYQEVIKNYPNGNKVPNAMLRQAIAFLQINDDTSAKILLNKIIKKYPNSSEAKIAETKLKTLK